MGRMSQVGDSVVAEMFGGDFDEEVDVELALDEDEPAPRPRFGRAAPTRPPVPAPRPAPPRSPPPPRFQSNAEKAARALAISYGVGQGLVRRAWNVPEGYDGWFVQTDYVTDGTHNTFLAYAKRIADQSGTILIEGFPLDPTKQAFHLFLSRGPRSAEVG